MGLQLRELPVPLVVGPTCGTDWWMCVQEWARQVTRWTIGNCETFHFIMVGVLRGPVPLRDGLWYAMKFLHMNFIMLIVSSVYTFLSLTVSPRLFQIVGIEDTMPT